MDSFELFDCQIDAFYMWRPGFDDNNPRVRVALFDDRLTLTNFEDASENLTRGSTLFAGPPSTSWREVVIAIIRGEEFATFNPEWPSSFSIVTPKDLKFTPDANTALKMISLSWLGAEWTQIANYLMEYPNDEIEQLDQSRNLLRVAFEISSEICALSGDAFEEKCPEEFIEALLAGEMSGETAASVADRLIADQTEEEL